MNIINTLQKRFVYSNRSYWIIFLLLFDGCFVFAQSVTSNTFENVSSTVKETPQARITCVAPSLMSYSVNNCFYCTGISITPNLLTYAGSLRTNLSISPDLPSGLNFDMNTGTISGTPIENISGNYTIFLNNACGSALKVIYISVSSGTNYYSDTDGDGYGIGVATVSCTGQPAGTSTNNTDCAPNNATKWKEANLFIDQDGDGYNNGFPAIAVCYGNTLPLGYAAVNIGTDCNDTNIKVNPNAVEIPSNGLDDNCDGFIDEVTITSNLIATSCGVTIPSLDTTLFAQSISGAEGYRFEVTNGINVRVLETTVNQFTLLNLSPSVTDSTHNTVRVAVKTGGFWRAYGTSCVVNTPPIPYLTSIVNPACGSVLSDIWNAIYCNNIPMATGYRFRVRNGTTIVGTYDSPVNRFSLPTIGINNLVFATSYTIDVLLQINNVWLPDTEYGKPCFIVTPPTPGVSHVTLPSCGSSISNLWTTIYALQVPGAQGYKFVINNGIQFREIVTATSSFTIYNIPGGPVPGTTYTIRVDVLYNNSYVPGRQLCTIIILPTAVRQSATELDIFEVKAYPNPYTDTFKLNVNTSSEDQVGISVYDMLGREVESREARVDNIANLEIGSRYPSGVYNIILTQGDNVKTLRVIKR